MESEFTDNRNRESPFSTPRTWVALPAITPISKALLTAPLPKGCFRLALVDLILPFTRGEHSFGTLNISSNS